jgi:hypothetical protein
MKTYGGVDVQIHVLLTSVLVGNEWSGSRACCFNPGESAPVPIEYGTVWTLETAWTL